MYCEGFFLGAHFRLPLPLPAPVQARESFVQAGAQVRVLEILFLKSLNIQQRPIPIFRLSVELIKSRKVRPDVQL